MNSTEARQLPGFLKKSFCMYFGGGEIRFEHLDGIYEFSDLVLQKLQADLPALCRPSGPSEVAFVLDETVITQEIVCAITDALLGSAKVFSRVCFVGTDKKATKALKRALRDASFALAFFDDLEFAKKWLVREGC